MVNLVKVRIKNKAALCGLLKRWALVEEDCCLPYLYGLVFDST